MDKTELDMKITNRLRRFNGERTFPIQALTKNQNMLECSISSAINGGVSAEKPSREEEYFHARK